MQREEGRRKHLSGIQEQLGGQAWAQKRDLGQKRWQLVPKERSVWCEKLRRKVGTEE